MAEMLPLFPLGAVLYPGMLLPLHIFEERYRQLVRDVPEQGLLKFGAASPGCFAQEFQADVPQVVTAVHVAGVEADEFPGAGAGCRSLP